MARLATCPDCGSNVSKNAKACPKCGRPLKKHGLMGCGCLSVSVAGVLGFLLLMFFFSLVSSVQKDVQRRQPRAGENGVPPAEGAAPVADLPIYTVRLPPPGRIAKAQIRALMARGQHTEAEFRDMALRLAAEVGSRSCVVAFYDADEAVKAMTEKDGAIDYTSPNFLCFVTVESNTGETRTDTFRIAKDLSTDREIPGILKP